MVPSRWSQDGLLNGDYCLMEGYATDKMVQNDFILISLHLSQPIQGSQCFKIYVEDSSSTTRNSDNLTPGHCGAVTGKSSDHFSRKFPKTTPA
ncbi:hypothetical protein T265_11294 [Opisthorchis viverrini]|uniref:Uncharacterized protein n=1 Tax=Opisthorchis viverrini TaxID=6198 RepID=A0A074Z3H8_OPIVI|nr:hypothetical protein T265_11294 [Opisthorchis viverrini]KER20072.1 hypothetical protein T265_11294 [Opisthorchis viverrini]